MFNYTYPSKNILESLSLINREFHNFIDHVVSLSVKEYIIHYRIEHSSFVSFKYLAPSYWCSYLTKTLMAFGLDLNVTVTCVIKKMSKLLR